METDIDLAGRISVACFGVEPRIEPIARLHHAVFRLRFPDATRVLKMAPGSDPSTIRKELSVIDLVTRQGIPAPTIEAADPEGSMFGRGFLIMRSAGERSAVEFVGLDGEVPRALFTEMGSVLARIHEVTFDDSGDLRPGGIVPVDPRVIRRAMDDLAGWSESRGFIEPAEAERFRSLPTPSLDGGRLCHRDFHAVQCVEQSGRISAVVDWESAWSSNPAVDLAITHGYLDFYCPAALKRLFFAGYQSTRPLPDDYERVSLPVRMAHSLGMIRVWDRQGLDGNIPRTVELYRAYLKAIDDR